MMDIYCHITEQGNFDESLLNILVCVSFLFSIGLWNWWWKIEQHLPHKNLRFCTIIFSKERNRSNIQSNLRLPEISLKFEIHCYWKLNPKWLHESTISFNAICKLLLELIKYTKSKQLEKKFEEIYTVKSLPSYSRRKLPIAKIKSHISDLFRRWTILKAIEPWNEKIAWLF